jgi:hypothetical protein
MEAVVVTTQDDAGGATTLCFHEGEDLGNTSTSASIAQWWLANNACDVVLYTSSPHHYVTHPRALLRLLALTKPMEMSIASMWGVLDDLDLVRVYHLHPDYNATASSTTGGGGEGELLNRNVKQMMPDSSMSTFLWFVGFTIVLIVLVVPFWHLDNHDKRGQHQNG